MLNFKKQFVFLIAITAIFAGSFGFIDNVEAEYVSTSTITSADLISESNVSSIDSFYYNATSIPSGTSLEFQFATSSNSGPWYNSSGSAGSWDTVSTTGGDTIDLSSLNWSANSFYYKMRMTSDGTSTPVLDNIKVNYTIDYSGLFTMDKTSGYIGIGTTSPSSLFTVGSSGNFQVNDTGQVTSGTWQGDLISSTYGGTGWDSSAVTGIPIINSGTWSSTSTINDSYISDTLTLSTSSSVAKGALINTGTLSFDWLDSEIENSLTIDANGSVQAEAIDQEGATTGQVLEWNGTNWQPATDDDTTYSAGNDLDLSGTTFSLEDDIDVDYVRATGASGLGLYDDASNGIFIEDGGNVGIGTNNPAKKLHVSGNIRASGGSPYLETYINETTGANLRTGGGGNTFFGFIGGSFSIRNTLGGDSQDDIFRVDNGASAHSLIINSSGNVGIGTTSPGSELSVSGGAAIGSSYSGEDISDGNTVIENSMAIGTTSFLGALHVSGGRSYFEADIELSENDVNFVDDWSVGTGGANALRFTQIGTGGAEAEIQGDGSDYTNVYLTLGDAVKLDSSSGDSYISSGNVGIGTTSPDSKLTIDGGNIEILGNNELYSYGSDTLGNRTYTENNYVTDAETFTYSIDALDQQIASIEGGESGLWLDQGSYIYSSNYNNFVITDSGSVGIGTTSPNYDLDVGGDINATNSLCIGGDCKTAWGDIAGTTYSAGNDLDLSGTTFNIESTLDHVSTINLDGTGSITGLDSIDATTENTLESALDHDDLTGFVTNEHIDHSLVSISSGSGLTGGGDITSSRTLSHADTSSQASSDNSGNTFIQDISLDGYGHLTGLTTGSVSNLDNYQSWTAQDDDGTTYSITSGDTLQFAEGAGIDSNFTADDVLTITATLGDSVEKGELVNSGTLSFDWVDSEVADNLTINTSGSVQAEAIDQEGASTGQVLEWNGTSWQPATDDDTTYSAGDYLTLSGTTFNVTDSWWDSVSDVPTATPSDGDTTHLSTADHIYDFVTGQGYITDYQDLGYVNSNAPTGNYATHTVTISNGTNAIIYDYYDPDTNTTYSAGNDLDLSGTTFNIESTLDHVSTINLDGTGSITGLDSIDATTENTLESALDHDDLTGFVTNEHIDHSLVSISSGSGLTGGGDITSSRTLSHADTSSQASSDNSGNTFIQDISLDDYGHLTGLTTGSVSSLDDYQSWTAQDDDGTTYSITSGDTLQFAEGAGIDSNFTADDVLTITATLGDSVEKGELVNSGTLSFDWADSEVADDLTISSSGSVDSTSLTDGGTISFDWVDAEVADNLTISSSGTVDKGSISGGTLGFDWADSEVADDLTINTSGSVQAEAIDQEGATTGQVLEWNGTSWQPATDDDTTYSAGDYLTLSGTTFNVTDSWWDSVSDVPTATPSDGDT